ncbi:MAG: S-layer homology domain-containing protein [Eubacteriales bacterium]
MMKYKRLSAMILVFCFVFTLLPAVALTEGTGVTYYVAKTGDDNNPGTEESPFANIQKAVNSAADGDTIIVKEGAYNVWCPAADPNNYTGNGHNLFIGKNITISGEGEVDLYSFQDSYLPALDTRIVVLISGSDGVVVDNLNLYPVYYPAGIATDLPTVTDSHINNITDNAALKVSYDRIVNALTSYNNGKPTSASAITNVTVKNCTIGDPDLAIEKWGSAIYFNGYYFIFMVGLSGGYTIENNILYGCVSICDNAGCDASSETCIIRNNAFYDNLILSGQRPNILSSCSMSVFPTVTGNTFHAANRSLTDTDAETYDYCIGSRDTNASKIITQERLLEFLDHNTFAGDLADKGMGISYGSHIYNYPFIEHHAIIYAADAPAAQIGGNRYATLAVALAAADSGDTVRLINDASIASTLTLNDDRAITLDLNGKTLTSELATAILLKKGTLNVVDTAEVKGGIHVLHEAFRVDGLGNTLAADAVLDIGENVNITSENDCCVFIRGKATLNTKGNLTSSGVYGTIRGEGALESAGTVINITGGEVQHPDGVAVYIPQANTFTVSGGTITGATGIYIKSGTLNITGGSIKGTGPDTAYQYSHGIYATGDALVIDSCGYPGGNPAVSITGGSFQSEHAAVVGSYAYGVGNEILTGFITGGRFAAAPDAAYVAAGYRYYNDSKLVLPAAAGIGTITYTTLASAVRAAKYGDTIHLLADNTEALTVSKVITIALDGFDIGAVAAGPDYVMTSAAADVTFSVSPGAAHVVSETVNTNISADVSPEDAQMISEVINLIQLNGVGDALSETGLNDIIAQAGVAPGEEDAAVVDVNVDVTVTESNLAEGTLTFTVIPSANVYVNGQLKNDIPIPLGNNTLDGSGIEVLLPLPGGFEPEEIIHISTTDGARERFLERGAFPRASKKFDVVGIDNYRFAKLTITNFSVFYLSDEASYAASVNGVNYYTLQDAIDAATGGQTIFLLQDCSDDVIINESLVIERGRFNFDREKIILGVNCTLQVNGTMLMISYAVYPHSSEENTEYSSSYPKDGLASPVTYTITASCNEGGTISPAGTTIVTKFSSKTYTIMPYTGYKISDVLVDGLSYRAISKYTFPSVTANHTIEAIFECYGLSKVFVDVDQSLWYREGIDFALLRGLLNGTSATTFEPNTDMTRAMLVTVLWRLDQQPHPTAASPFTDTAKGAWYTDAVIWAAEKGLVKGYDADTFGPNDPITREQMAAILSRYASYKGYDVTAAHELTAFADAGDVSEWALAAIKWAVSEGLMIGNSEKSLAPLKNVTRAQVATILMRFIKNTMK